MSKFTEGRRCGMAAAIALLSAAASAQTTVNTTVQDGRININHTFQCGDSAANETVQSGRVNVNHTVQRCGGQGHGRAGAAEVGARDSRGGGAQVHARAVGPRW